MTVQMSNADIHIHTRYSDGENDVAEVLRYVAEKTNLSVVAITDHDTVVGALEARRIAPTFGVEVVVGAEISTAEGHLLALFIEQCVPAGLSARETVALVHEQGGLCVAAHPFGMLVPSLARQGWRRMPRSLAGLGLDGIECINASLWSQHNNRLAERCARDIGVALCAGSDSHHLTTIGSGFTRFPGHTADHLHTALIERQTESAGRFWGWKEVGIAIAPWARREVRGLVGRRLEPETTP